MVSHVSTVLQDVGTPRFWTVASCKADPLRGCPSTDVPYRPEDDTVQKFRTLPLVTIQPTSVNRPLGRSSLLLGQDILEDPSTNILMPRRGTSDRAFETSASTLDPPKTSQKHCIRENRSAQSPCPASGGVSPSIVLLEGKELVSIRPEVVCRLVVGQQGLLEDWAHISGIHTESFRFPHPVQSSQQRFKKGPLHWELPPPHASCAIFRLVSPLGAHKVQEHWKETRAAKTHEDSKQALEAIAGRLEAIGHRSQSSVHLTCLSC